MGFHIRSVVGVAGTPRPISRLLVQGETILVRPAPSVVHSPQSGLGGVSQLKKPAPIGTRGNGSLLKRSPIRTGREAIVGFNEETLSHPFFFIAGDSLNPVPPHSRH